MKFKNLNRQSMAGLLIAAVIFSFSNIQTVSAVEFNSETTDFGEYRVQPGDVIEITVYEEPDLSTRTRVSGSGKINFPLLGGLDVAGLSVNAIQENITAALEEDYLVDPQVHVFIGEFHERSVFITGAVNNPGSYPLPIEKMTTVVEAITMAGGFTEEAAMNKTQIVRVSDGREEKIQIRAGDVVKQGNKSLDLEVKANDVIFVPESFF